MQSLYAVVGDKSFAAPNSVHVLLSNGLVSVLEKPFGVER